MKLAFWKAPWSQRSTTSSGAAAGPLPDFAAAPDGGEEEAAARAVRVRTRRQLIGASALLLAAVVLIPMILDPTPAALPDTIPIDLPSDKTPFSPQLPPSSAVAPSVAETAVGADGTLAPPAAPGLAADAAAEAAPADSGAAADAAATTTPADAASRPLPKRAAEADKTAVRRSAHATAAAAVAGGGKIYLQAASLVREAAAHDLAARLVKSGLNAFVERSDSSEGVRYRVRLGPYATRGEAEHSRSRLHALGLEANIVGA